jgi:hypothetical protein
MKSYSPLLNRSMRKDLALELDVSDLIIPISLHPRNLAAASQREE